MQHFIPDSGRVEFFKVLFTVEIKIDTAKQLKSMLQKNINFIQHYVVFISFSIPLFYYDSIYVYYYHTFICRYTYLYFSNYMIYYMVIQNLF